MTKKQKLPEHARDLKDRCMRGPCFASTEVTSELLWSNYEQAAVTTHFNGDLSCPRFWSSTMLPTPFMLPVTIRVITFHHAFPGGLTLSCAARVISRAIINGELP